MTRVWNAVANGLRKLATGSGLRGGQRPPATTGHGAPRPGPRAPRPGPATGGRQLAYAPQLDGQADPGEIVWTWVAYEDEPGQGKDRPVLVVGRQGATLWG
ncbi:MAG TPA: type II toxin-antitoxin system PemK/MazF family toxin, partial [Catenuloplanes sp.]